MNIHSINKNKHQYFYFKQIQIIVLHFARYLTITAKKKESNESLLSPQFALPPLGEFLMFNPGKTRKKRAKKLTTHNFDKGSD